MTIRDGLFAAGSVAAAAVALVAVAMLRAPQAHAPAAVPSAAAPAEPERYLRALFVGDVMLDRGVARRAAREGADSLAGPSLRALFAGNDANVGNLEGTITASSSVALVDPAVLRFTFGAELAREYLLGLGFTHLSSANNHGLDFGREGLAETWENLDRWGIESFGSPLNDVASWTSFSVDGRRVCLTGYHDLFTYDPAPVEALVAQVEPDCWRTAVLPHWGNEYETWASPRQRELARKFVDAGADIVVGAHPHVVQPLEVYRGAPIFYSLGNFAFDQDFSFETTHALALRVEFGERETRVTPVPLSVVRAFAEVDASEAADLTLAALVDEVTPVGIAEAAAAGETFSVARE